MIKMMTKEKTENLERIKELAPQGNLKQCIDQTFTLDKIVPAHEYVDSGRKPGFVIIEIINKIV
jgi:alcohol dehydrogenase